MEGVIANRGVGRPRGRQHDVTLHVTVPRPVLDMLRQLASQSRVSVAALVRSGVVAALSTGIKPAVAVVRDRGAPARRRLKALRLLWMVSPVLLRTGPLGLKLAQAEAAARRNRTG